MTITSAVADVDPNTAGIQVLEGTTIPIRAAVSDDVQVRNVELLVLGVRGDEEPVRSGPAVPTRVPRSSPSTRP